MAHYRALFMNDSQECKCAADLLAQHAINFSPEQVSPNSSEFGKNDLPLLMTDEGQWRGLSSIERYVQDCSPRELSHQ